MLGFKVFRNDWTCYNGFQYEVGKSFEMDCAPRVCDCGFHFCNELVDCFEYYSFDPKNKVAEIEAYGEIDTDGKKSATNKIRIIRELSWEEVLRRVNVGESNAGYRNSGDWNSGNRNSGDWNSGDWNSGNRNSGDWNSGNGNSGNRNSGNGNSGDWNSGDWNKTCFSNGCFNTEEPKIYMFNKPSNWTYRDWLDSAARIIFEKIDTRLLEWIYFDQMTDAEKEANPEAKTTDGYLKTLDKTDCYKLWWDGLKPYEKGYIKNLPNFDAAIFKEIFGIEV